MRVLISGMTGFVGHHVADYLLETTDWELVGLDRIDATSTLERLKHVRNWTEHASRCRFVWHDLRSAINSSVDRQIGPVDVVLHLAASTHVDRSIAEPIGFVLDNVLGTAHLLDWWRQRKAGVLSQPVGETFLYFGTDEIFGPAPGSTAYKEWDRYHSTNPYSATKAGAEELAGAFANTYGLRVVATHTMNVIGERQHPEKFVPMTIRKVRRGETVVIHADHMRLKSGSRFYLHARNAAAALQYLVAKRYAPCATCSVPGTFDKYNIVGAEEVTNLDMAHMIAGLIGKPLRYEMVDFHSSRPGHDLRYALDGEKLFELGFRFPMTLEESLERTVKWFMDNPWWLEE